MNYTLTDLNCKNWKNYLNSNFHFEKGINLIVGKNGGGKSSLLEAIHFCMIGELRKGSKRTIKRIGAGREKVEVKLTISNSSDIINIQRSFNGRSENQLKMGSESPIVNKELVKEKIEDIFNAHLAFIRRMIYYGEGETFELLSEGRRKRKFKDYIEELLEIPLLLKMRDDMKKNISKINSDRSNFKNIIKKISKYPIENLSSIEYNLTNLKKSQEELNQEFKNIKIEVESVNTRKKNYQNELVGFERFLLNIEGKFNIKINAKVNDYNLIYKLEQEIIGSKEKISLLNRDLDNVENALKKLDFEIEFNYQIKNLIDLLLSHTKFFDKKIQCPVCDTLKELNIFKQKFKLEVAKISYLDDSKKKTLTDIREIEKQLTSLNSIIANNNNLIMKLKTFQGNWDEIFNSYSNNKKKIMIIQEEIEELYIKKAEIESHLQNINKKLVDEQEIYQNYSNTKNLLNEEYIDMEGKVLDHSHYLIATLEKSINNVVKNIRDNYLDPIIKEISNIWFQLFQKTEETVAFDKNLNPILKKNKGVIHFENLSGGEKTILSILTRTLLMSQFSTLSFMVLDEPLEHLDFENRIKMLDYLVEYCKSGFIDQLIITTFEETITRKFSTNPYINFIYLD